MHQCGHEHFGDCDVASSLPVLCTASHARMRLHPYTTQTPSDSSETPSFLPPYSPLWPTPRYETHLSDMRAQSANLYREHAAVKADFDKRQQDRDKETAGLREERDALAIRANRLEELLDIEDRAATDPSAPHRLVLQHRKFVVVRRIGIMHPV